MKSKVKTTLLTLLLFAGTVMADDAWTPIKPITGPLYSRVLLLWHQLISFF